MIRPADPPIPFDDDDENKKPYDPLDKDADPFKPPDQPIEVGCLHCQCIFMSDQITWRILTNAEGKQHGFWCCPDPACDGKGFGFDLLPTDPNYRDENGGWVYLDDEDDEEEFDEEFDELSNNTPDSFDPPKEWSGDDDDIPF